MGGENIAHFDLVKQQNKKIIRNLLRKESPQSVAQLASKSALTYPTVASLLKELEHQGEVIKSQVIESCGGRPGVKYELNEDYQYGLVLCFKEKSMTAKVYNVYGQMVKEFAAAIYKEVKKEEVLSFIFLIHKEYENLTVISIGVPGVVLNNSILFLPAFKDLEGTEFCQMLKDRFQCEVYAENDVNAIAIAEVKDHDSFAHIAYVNHCIGAGIVLNGEVFNGANGYAGELEYLCKDITNAEESLVSCIMALTCVLNLPLVYISGEECTLEVADAVSQKLNTLLPKDSVPKIVVTEDLDNKYEEGLYKRILLYWENTI